MGSPDSGREYSSSSSSSCLSHFWSSALRVKRVSIPAEKAFRENPSHGLSRQLGVLDLLLLGIGASVGAGIFVITGTVAHDTGPGTCSNFAYFELNFGDGGLEIRLNSIVLDMGILFYFLI